MFFFSNYPIAAPGSDFRRERIAKIASLILRGGFGNYQL